MSFEWSEDSNKGNMVAPYFALFSISQSVVHKLILYRVLYKSQFHCSVQRILGTYTFAPLPQIIDVVQ